MRGLEQGAQVPEPVNVDPAQPVSPVLFSQAGSLRVSL